jgi:hypothetical protein
MDTNTPVTAFLVRVSIALLGDNHLALRMPMILGYWGMCLCIYAFVSYRCPKVYGMAAMLLPPVASSYFFATEARAYGIILGAAALAYLSWQRATSERQTRRPLWLLLLGASLALCISLHYFCAFLWVPLVCAEVVRIWERKRIDWPIVLVLMASLGTLGFFVPMMLQARQNFMGGFWARTSLGEIENSYRFILTLAFSPLLGAAIAWLLVTMGVPKQAEGRLASIPLAERVLIGLLALMPFYVVPATFLIGTFVPRYVLPTLIGLSILLATAACRRARGNVVVAVILAACLGGWFVLKYPMAARRQMAETGYPSGHRMPFANKGWARAIEEKPGMPVIVSPAVFYVQLQHYSAPEVRQRTYYLTSLVDALKLDGADTGDRSLKLFQRRFPVQVPDYYEFTKANHEFLLLAETTNPTWVIEKLLADGADLKLVRRDQTYFLYHVAMPTPVRGN